MLEISDSIRQPQRKGINSFSSHTRSSNRKNIEELQNGTNSIAPSTRLTIETGRTIPDASIPEIILLQMRNVVMKGEGNIICGGMERSLIFV